MDSMDVKEAGQWFNRNTRPRCIRIGVFFYPKTLRPKFRVDRKLIKE